ncbi:hypothetical protein FB451DRAFT_1187466 [Mycena latifolia]|nr:hypothetical protein FB451DRAFT_1187466 [Mycena latifolia]
MHFLYTSADHMLPDSRLATCDCAQACGLAFDLCTNNGGSPVHIVTGISRAIHQADSVKNGVRHRQAAKDTTCHKTELISTGKGKQGVSARGAYWIRELEPGFFRSKSAR